MKIALICPSNMMYMPYIDNYIKILQESNCNYDIILWDRFHLDSAENKYQYRDSKIGHKRNYFDYLKYKHFIKEKLTETKYERIIVFGLQISYFLYRDLINNYSEKYIIDIRDYNRISKFCNLKKLIEHSSFTVISSLGYKKWLPESNKLVLNHNTNLESVNLINEFQLNLTKNEINIAYIGALRDYNININFINALKNSKNFRLEYHGHGEINNDLINHLEKYNIKNVFLTGKYLREEEPSLYLKSSLVNALIPNNDINSKTLMPNRFYNAAIYGKPVICYSGSFLAEQVKKYSLGLVIQSFGTLEIKIREYLNNFNQADYESGRKLFLNEAINDNRNFKHKLEEFI
ncbi:hypothetical protein AJ85_03745 [Alkalihalobacillus alcalophilus ATCC 27647 = CGMCC 1.3604]|uniref:Capsular biosynthesis protein n=1 Tax=Alkalihalobacillus alcalophilus ATCC 27647 = CGMCC 1.3604 TaxID=1218173 RepID=A0A094YS48_ALKAL|nr:hypothetical protein [Alkalihalobacillus alcalophilus]KGA96287.1 hypothetical protein BALCAV_0217190 [Alkalihalobacillus alcalophilus ATCC 27647 = CGMCC 1.3604]MED1563389.1 hypothetical protein [Alkalihalobacillus alcalophilus]THG91644.1 hypothetical protein AJ85_03745 [Alkalihalobacillus alcalophilus ATCC 27647 = CGMCC 1.3604]